MFDLVSLAYSLRIEAHHDLQFGLVAELLQVLHPRTVPRRVTSPAVGTDEDSLGILVVAHSEPAPPAANGTRTD